MGKGENAGNQHFLLFPQCFLISTHPETNFCFWATFILSSANALNLDQSKSLSFGEELMCLQRVSNHVSQAQSVQVGMGRYFYLFVNFLEVRDFFSPHDISRMLDKFVLTLSQTSPSLYVSVAQVF